MYTHHKFDHQFGFAGGPSLTYAVCSVPRCGSSLLCELLLNSGLGGAPTEYFDTLTMRGFQATWGATSFERYLAELTARKTGPNGVLGLKLHYYQLEEGLEGRELTDVFPAIRFVYMRRRDHLRQAVSYSRARQDNRWAWDHPREGGRLAFDADQIRECLRWIEEQERGWERWFEQRGVDPIRVVYEDLLPRQERIVLEILGRLGVEVPPGAQVPPPTLRRQADWRNEAWVRRFRRLERYGSDSLIASVLARLARSRRPGGT